MPISRLLNAALVLGILAAPAALAAQQDADDKPARFDLALGFSIGGPADVNQKPKCIELALPCNTPKTFPDFGFLVQGVYRATTHFGFAGEASFYDNRWDSTGVNHDYSNHVSAFLIGPRVETTITPFPRAPNPSKYTVFAQALFGPESSTSVETRTAFQPGLGIEGKISPERLSCRFAYDYRYTHGEGRNLSGGRFMLALVIAFAGDAGTRQGALASPETRPGALASPEPRQGASAPN